MRLPPATLLRCGWNYLRRNGEAVVHAVPLPRALCLYVTRRCNLRCLTCGIWRETPTPEPPVDETLRILGDPLFRHLETINLNGGEPNLHPDLPGLTARLLDMFPRLKSLSLNSNGMPAGRTLAHAAAVAGLCRARRIPFSISISMHHHSPDEIDRICGVPGAGTEVQEGLLALRAARERHGYFLSTNCVISAANADALPAVRAWNRERGIPVNFVLAEVRERFGNAGTAADFRLDEPGKRAVVAFLRSLAAGERELRHHRLRYHELAEMLEHGRKRRLSCHYRMGGVILDAGGEVFYCKQSRAIGNGRHAPPRSLYYDPENLAYRRRELLGTICPECPPNTFNRLEVEKDLHHLLLFSLRRPTQREPR